MKDSSTIGSNTKQTGFRHGIGTVDQIPLQTNDIKHSFDEKKKVGAVFVDLSWAYDTVWHRGLTLKLLKIIPNKNIVKMIEEMIRQKFFVLHLSNAKSRKRRLANGVTQDSVLAPILFNICMADISLTNCKKYIYADGIAITTSGSNFKTIENKLSTDLAKLPDYFHNWRLKLNPLKTVSSCFHLANRLVKYQLNVSLHNQAIPFTTSLKYLGKTLDRSLTYRQHLQNITAKRMRAATS